MTVLVTTALQQTWPKDGQETLFLGEWCKKHNCKQSWTKLSWACCEYHWNDRSKLYSDYQLIQSIYESILNDLTETLNEIHEVNHSLRYWRIVIGPWLNYFLGVLFDRWEMLTSVAILPKSFECAILERKFGELIPYDMNHFNSLYTDDDWNEAIYAELLTNYFSDSINIKKVKREKKHIDDSASMSVAMQIKSRVLSYFDYTKSKKSQQGQYVIAGLSRMTSLSLQCKLRQRPKFWHSHEFDQVEPIESSRQWSILNKVEISSFEKIARAMVVNHIPSLYLEGYLSAVSKIKSLDLPKRPEIVFTTNRYSSDEFFKLWCAETIDSGSRLIIAQHGGHYGSGLFSATEEHEIKISDKYLTWGWTSPKSDKTVVVGNLEESAKPVKYNKDGWALIVGLGIPRYSYRMYAIPVANQWLDYFEEQSQFVAGLNANVVNQLVVRPYNKDYGWDMKSRWRARYPSVVIDNGQKSIRNMMSQTRIYIATYNATTYLESLLWNVPTIIFWNPKHWELRPEAKESYDLLKSVGIFHESPYSAAAKINQVWDDIDLWWRSDAVQTARVQFCHEFSRPMDNKAKKLSEIFSTLKKSK
jgi:putative transferase (TIGR04331 family)